MTAESAENDAVVADLSISEAARFFGKSIAWVRLKERSGDFVRENGEPIVPRRTQPRRAKEGQRRYSLVDIEEMAESLHRKEQISQDVYEDVMKKVQAFK